MYSTGVVVKAFLCPIPFSIGHSGNSKRHLKMGNWTTVHISGTCNADDVPKLKRAINAYKDNQEWDQFHCLCNTRGLCGLGDWASESISAVGNLAERDYDARSVRDQLIELQKVAPSLTLKVHVGGDYESLNCVATVICKDGVVSIEEPQIEMLPSIPEGQMMGNLIVGLLRGRL